MPPTVQLVTFIVPTRDSGRTLDACLRSIREQEGRPTELIVVDNNSSDATLEIARRHADRVETWGPERSAQRNRGAALSSGEVLVFIDSDMVLARTVARDIVDLLSAAPSVAAVVIPERSFGEGFWSRCRGLEKELSLGDPSTEAARVFRAEAFEATGGYDESLTGPEDWDLPDRVRLSGGLISRLPTPVWHDEGRPRLRDVFRKKHYYGRSFGPYLRKQRHGGGRKVLRGALLRQPALLLGQPGLAVGLVVLKAIDLAGVASGAMAEWVRPTRSSSGPTTG